MSYFLPVVVFFFYQYFTMWCCDPCFKKQKNKEARRRAFNEAKSERNLRFLNAVKKQRYSNSNDILLSGGGDTETKITDNKDGTKIADKDLLNKVLVDLYNGLNEMNRNQYSDPEIKRLVRPNFCEEVDKTDNNIIKKCIDVFLGRAGNGSKATFMLHFSALASLFVNFNNLTEKFDISTIIGFVLQKLDHLDALLNIVFDSNVVIKMSLDLESINFFLRDHTKNLFKDVSICDSPDNDEDFSMRDYDKFIVEIDPIVRVKKYDSSSNGYNTIIEEAKEEKNVKVESINDVEKEKNADDKTFEWISKLINFYVDFSNFCQLYKDMYNADIYVYYRNKQLYFYLPTIENLGISDDIEKFNETDVELNNLSESLDSLLEIVNQQDGGNLNLVNQQDGGNENLQQKISNDLNNIKKRLDDIKEIIENSKPNYDFLCKLRNNVVIPDRNDIDSFIEEYENFKNKNNVLQKMYNDLETKAKERGVNVQVNFDGFNKKFKDFFGFLGM